jgi:lipopolysaccharide/colanic/teichoic acid biosynthesis glycosyltransferase
MILEPVKLPKEKRIFDIIVSIILLILGLPFILLVLLSMALEAIFAPSSRGSVFYTETRISQGQPFKFYKFRIFKTASLKKHFNECGFVQTKTLEQDGNNLTFTGRGLKKIYMDELPQLLCVLKGDMTLVGPRPTNVVVSQQDYNRGQYFRYLIKCGITGYFQAHKDVRLDKSQAEIDMEYINFVKTNPGWKVVVYDVKILLATILTVLRAKGL